MPKTFGGSPKTRHKCVENARLILKHAYSGAESLLTAFDTVRKARSQSGRVPRGMPRDTDQDLLRAMVVFAGAGLDAMTKQLVKDALPVILQKDEPARTKLQEFTRRSLRDDRDEKFLAEVLLGELGPNTRDELVELLIVDLTKGSLQSTEEIHATLAHLGLNGKDVGLQREELRPVFECRNQIIHELDINLSAKRRNRTMRKRDDMVGYTKQLLELSDAILSAVDGKL